MHFYMTGATIPYQNEHFQRLTLTDSSYNFQSQISRHIHECQSHQHTTFRYLVSHYLAQYILVSRQNQKRNTITISGSQCCLTEISLHIYTTNNAINQSLQQLRIGEKHSSIMNFLTSTENCNSSLVLTTGLSSTFELHRCPISRSTPVAKDARSSFSQLLVGREEYTETLQVVTLFIL